MSITNLIANLTTTVNPTTVGAPVKPGSETSQLGAVTSPSAVSIPLICDSLGGVPEFTAVAQPITLPAAPSWNLGDAPEFAENFTQVSLPEAPTFTLPVAPDFEPIVVPDTPPLDTVTFDATAVQFDLPVPGNNFSHTEIAYAPALLDQFDAELLGELYGIVDSDEAVAFNRARSKLVRDSVEKARSMQAEFAMRGFWLPPGAMLAAIDAVHNEVMEKSAEISSKLAEQRADTYVDMHKVGVQTAMASVKLRRAELNGRLDRTLEAEQTRVENALAVYRLAVQRLELGYENYRTSAKVFENRIQAAKLALDAYKTQLEAKYLGVEVQKLNADIYKTQLQGYLTYVNIYKTQMEAANIALSVERLKLEAYKSKVDAYGAQVGSKEAESRLYEAQINGEMSKIELFKSEIAAMSARVDASKSKVQAQETCLRGQIAGDKYRLDVRKAELAKYAEELGYLKNRLRAQQELYGVDVDAYEARNKANRLLTEAAAMIATSRVEILLAQTSLALDYDIASRWLNLAQAKILSSAAIAYSSIDSSARINLAKNQNTAEINTARNLASENISNMKLTTQQDVSTAENNSRIRIAANRANQQANLSNIQRWDSTYINNERSRYAGSINANAERVFQANMAAAHAQKAADLTLVLLK